ncbi:outer membrane protein transport protein [Hahella sp. SMD15-11]|uniref:Outer membrane protein transport protein n=1 Tax=Thermohahella caldifontis TaxID=3142973 RepID=A0AB39UYM4_9GAMM
MSGLAGVSQAQLGQNLLVDPKALSLGNAVTADPPGISSIHYNPAGLAYIKGRKLEVNLLNPALNIEASFEAPEGYNIFGIDGVKNDPVVGERSKTRTAALYIPGWGLQRLPKGPGLLPTGGFMINPPGSRFTFANAFYAPQFVGFYRKNNDPARYNGKTVALERITYLSPTFGYEINDEWKVGLGINFSYQALALDQYMRAPNMMLGVVEILQDAFNCESGREPLAPFLGLCGGNIGPWDDIGGLHLELQETLSPTYNVGVIWQPTPWFRWGASYQSEGKMNMKGTFELNYTPDWAGFWQSFNGSIFGAISAAIFSLPSGVPREAGNVTMHLRYPQHFQTGISVDVHPKLTLNVDVGWTDYSVWDAFKLEFDRNLEFLGAARLLAPENATSNTLKLPLEYHDVWNWAFGAEFHVNSRVDLRAGVEIRDTVIPENRRDVLAPLGGANMYSLGMGYRWSRDTDVSFSATYMRSFEQIPAGTSCNVNCDDLQNIVYNPYAGLNVTTKLKIIILGLSFRTSF